MALPILDGNQTAATLSTVLTGGEHIPAHTVVSLGSQAITDVRSAVSGSVVTIPNLDVLARSVATEGIADGTLNFVKIGGHQDGSNQTAHIVHVSGGGAMKVDASGSSVTFSQASVTFGQASVTFSQAAVTFNAITGSASILNFPSTQTVAGTVTVGGFSTVSVGGVLGSLLVGGKRGSSVESLALDTATGYLQTKVESMPAISGTVTANLSSTNLNSVTIGVRGSVTADIGNSVTISSLPAISGTVTVGSLPDGVNFGQQLAEGYDNYGGAPVQIVASSITQSISGTVTANLAKPTWTDYSGSVTTAGTAVTAISETSRSYLLAQVTTGQMFLNIGATATTSNSVYFSAGQGFAWETTVPQGIVSIISTVTGTKYVLKSG